MIPAVKLEPCIPEIVSEIYWFLEGVFEMLSFPCYLISCAKIFRDFLSASETLESGEFFPCSVHGGTPPPVGEHGRENVISQQTSPNLKDIMGPARVSATTQHGPCATDSCRCWCMVQVTTVQLKPTGGGWGYPHGPPHGKNSPDSSVLLLKKSQLSTENR